MKKMHSFVFAALVVAEVVSFAAASNQPQAGKIVSESSVDCGTKKQGRKQMDLVCQEYVMRTATTEYHIRQPKQKNQTLLPLNADINFEMDKDKMKFKADGKKFEFLVVSETVMAPEAK